MEMRPRRRTNMCTHTPMQLPTNLCCRLHMALVGLHVLAGIVDCCTCLTPTREFWTQKGCHSRIRHVDPPRSNLFRLLMLRNKPEPMIQVPDAADKCATVTKTRAGALLECENVNKNEKLLCHPTRKSTTPKTELHPALVDMTTLIPPRAFWTQKGCHSRIRHVDPPRSNLFR